MKCFFLFSMIMPVSGGIMVEIQNEQKSMIKKIDSYSSWCTLAIFSPFSCLTILSISFCLASISNNLSCILFNRDSISSTTVSIDRQQAHLIHGQTRLTKKRLIIIPRNKCVCSISSHHPNLYKNSHKFIKLKMMNRGPKTVCNRRTRTLN